MAEHVIHFYGRIHDKSFENLRNVVLQAIQAGAATSIQLRLSSEGGFNNAGFTCYHFLRAITVPLTIHNLGSVESMAVPIFLAGQTRLALPHSRFMLHALHWAF